MAPSPIQLIVGLGNPGPEHKKTRHNVGIWFVEQLLKDQHAELKPEKKFFGSTTQTTLFHHTLFLLIPSTYMNCSGKSVSAVAKFYKIPPQTILIAHDELALPVGVTRLKQGGGHAGHNGLRDIISHLGSHDFVRLRIGIDHPGHRDRVSQYVLNPPKKNEKIAIEHSIDDAIHALPLVLEGRLHHAMQLLHTKIEDQ